MANDAGKPLSFGSKPMSLARLSVVVCLSAAVLMTGLGQASSQDFPNRFVQRFGVQPKPRPDATVTPSIEATSALGQALAACEKDATAQEPFALPGLKNEVTLDRCYKGRAHLVCVFNALIAEASALTESYTKIVEAKYPDFNSVEGICKLNREALATDIGGSEDFTKRFVALKAQYESASRCAGSVKQAFRDVVLADMAQPPEILKSMTDSIDSDVNRVSQVQNQIGELATKIEISKKAMKTIDKIHRTMCIKDKDNKDKPGSTG